MTTTEGVPRLHDWNLRAYRVDCERRSIVLEADHQGESDEVERVAVRSHGVDAYQFVDDAFGNVLFELEEVLAETLWAEQKDQLRLAARRAGAVPWALSDDAALAHLRDRRLRAFRLS